MPKMDIEFNQEFFDTILKSPGVQALVDKAAEEALDYAKENAEVDTGAYRDGLHIEKHESAYRTVDRVVGDDPKTLIIESRTGNLAKALKQASV